MGRFFYIKKFLTKNKIKFKTMKFPQLPNSIISHYYLQDLIDYDDLTAAGESLISNCLVLNPENLLLLSQEIEDQNQEIQSVLQIKGAENTQSVFTSTNEILASDQKHIKIKKIAEAILSKLEEINKAAYFMQFPIEVPSGIQTVISSDDFNQLNYKQNLNQILGIFAPQQTLVNSQDELLSEVLKLQNATNLNKLVLKNPTVEGGMGVKIIHNLQNLNQTDLIKIVEQLGKSPCYLIEEFL